MDIQSLSRSSWNYFSENVVSTLNSTEKKVLVFALSIFSVLAIGYYFYRFCKFDKIATEVKVAEEDLIEEEEIESEKIEVLEEKQTTDMRVVVDFLLKKKTFNVGRKATVDDLKEKIQNNEGIPSEYQKLLFRGRHLEDGKKLEDYGIIFDDCVVYLPFRIRGD